MAVGAGRRVRHIRVSIRTRVNERVVRLIRANAKPDPHGHDTRPLQLGRIGIDVTFCRTVANAELRKSHRYTARKRATIEQLADAAGYTRQHLPVRAGQLGVDLEPYLLLIGQAPSDPETSDKI